MKDPEAYIYNFQLTKVIDGDTVRGHISLGFNICLENKTIRINQIDTPESRINTKKYPHRIREKELGLLAKEKMKEWLTDELKIKSYGPDKYGRVLADVFCSQGNVADLLKEHNPPLAVDYDGGTKTKIWE